MSTKGWDTSDPSNASALPEWAVEKARASLHLGISVPDIEKRLVAGGLSLGAAEAVVNRILEADVRAAAGVVEHKKQRQIILLRQSAIGAVALETACFVVAELFYPRSWVAAVVIFPVAIGAIALFCLAEWLLVAKPPRNSGSTDSRENPSPQQSPPQNGRFRSKASHKLGVGNTDSICSKTDVVRPENGPI